MTRPVLTADEILAFLDEAFPQSGHLRMRIERLDAKSIRVRLPVDETNLRPGGTISGPTLMWLADCSMYMLILAQIGKVPLAVTTSLQIDFMRRPKPSDVIAEGRLLKLGKRIAVGDVLITSDGAEDEPVARASVTYSIPPSSASEPG